MNEVMLRVFACEAQEKLDEMKEGLSALARGVRDSDTFDGVFEAAHGLKSGAEMVEANAIEDFARTLEILLEQSRAGTVEVTPEMIGVMMAGCDHLLALIGQLSARPESSLGLADVLCDRVAQGLPDLLGRIGAPAAPAAVAQHPDREDKLHG